MIRTALCLVACIAFASASAQEPPVARPGKLVDVGGWRLHLNCTGERKGNQPLVILEPGVGDFSVEWSLVQPGVSQFARVCSYDRAGDGWSDLGPHPRTFRQIVYELHTLLANAKEAPPYLMVGHSYGGWLVRQYQLTYPAEVSALLLVEAGADDPYRIGSDGRPVRSSQLPAGRVIPEINTTRPLRLEDIPPVALTQMKAGAAQLASDPNPAPRNKLPADAQRMRGWTLAQVGHVAAGVNPVELEELALLRSRTTSEHPLDTLPLIVITRGLSDGDSNPGMEAEHRKDHERVASLSRRGQLVVASRSGHHVQLDEPNLVVDAIRRLLTKP